MTKFIHIDGSTGEGGGQMLRTSIALSLVTGRPFEIEKIRGGRKKGGLLRQHLTAVNAAAEISDAKVEGAAMGSSHLRFCPGKITPGDYSFSIGTAGSSTLVLQTVLPALAMANGPSTLKLSGGTHNPYAPPFDFLKKAFAPCLEKMGVKTEYLLESYGFYPAGGGAFTVSITPKAKLTPVTIEERGGIVAKRVSALLSKLTSDIGERELKTLSATRELKDAELSLKASCDSPGPGNILFAEIESEHITEVFTGFGEKGVSAEKVAHNVAAAVKRYLVSNVPVGDHLADQLLLLMALAGKGSFKTLRPTAHTMTNADVIKKFLDVDITFNEEKHDIWKISVNS